MVTLQSPETRFAVQAVRRAALLVRQVQEELVSSALTKDDRSPVTVADFASQASVAYQLSQSFPQDGLVAEESSFALQQPEQQATLDQIVHFVRHTVPGASPQDVCRWIDWNRVDTAGRFWTLDPIDGTKGFLRGDQYAVAFALIEDGQVQAGALGCPNLSLDGRFPGGLLAFAARGQGAWAADLTDGDLEDRSGLVRLQVSTLDDPAQARVLRSFESGHTNVSKIDIFAERLGVLRDPVRLDSQAKYALLAAGEGELYLRLLSSSRPDYREKIWDQAAGALVLAEAGGRITDLHGRDLDFTLGRTLAANRGILASNGALHSAALDALRAIDA